MSDSPATPSARPRPTVVTISALLGAIGIWWLIHFTRPSMKALFAEDGPIAPARIPFTVALIGWATVLGGVACLLLALLRVPAALGGTLLTGWLAGAFYLVLAIAQFFIGRGLLVLDERARRAGVVFFSLATLCGIAAALLPGARDAALAYGQELGASVGAPSLFALDGVWWLLTALLILGFALPAWLLVKWHHAFARGD